MRMRSFSKGAALVVALVGLASCASVSKMNKEPFDRGFAVVLRSDKARASEIVKEAFESEGFDLLSEKTASDGSVAIVAVLRSSFQSWGQYMRVILVPVGNSAVLMRVHNVKRLESNASEILEPVRKRIVMNVNARVAEDLVDGGAL